MRRIVFAATFVDDANQVAEYVEATFGATRANEFVADLNHFCVLVASQPGIGKQNHGYSTTLFGVVHERNWILFTYDDEAVHFVHIVESARHKPTIFF